LRAVAGYVSVTALLLLWKAVRSCGVVICGNGYWYQGFWGSSV